MSSGDDELPATLPRWEIPSDWQWVSIADVGKIITGNTPPTKDESNYGNFIPFVKPPALTDKGIRSTPEGLSETGIRSSRILPAGAVLVSCIGGLGKTGIAKVTVAFNQQINAIVFDQRVIPEFGFYYAQTLKPWLHGVASATTLPIVNKGKFQRAPFPLAPLDQQKRIVAEIEKQFSRLDEAVANLKRVKANLKRYKAAVLKAAVEGRLVETEAERARREGRNYETGVQLLQRILETRRSQWKGKGKYKEPAAPDTTALPELPEGWVWATVDLVCEQIVDCPHSTARFMPDGYPCIDTTWMTKEGLAVQRARYVDEVTYQERIARLAPKPGDIVFAREGTIGTAILVPERMKPCLGQRVMLLRPSIHFLGSLLRYTLHSEIVRSQYLAQALGSTVPHINVGDVKAFRIPVPPLAEQHRIVAEVDRRLSILGGTESQADVNLQRSERLRQAILAKAFSGLLVNQSIPREAISARIGKR